jgi:hypothetical protein
LYGSKESSRLNPYIVTVADPEVYPKPFLAYDRAAMDWNIVKIIRLLHFSGKKKTVVKTTNELRAIGLFADETCIAEKWDVYGDDLVGGEWSLDPAQDRARLDPNQNNDLRDDQLAKLTLDWIVKPLDHWIPWPLLATPVRHGFCTNDNNGTVFFHILMRLRQDKTARLGVFGSDCHAGFQGIHRVLAGIQAPDPALVEDLDFEILAPKLKRFPFGSSALSNHGA